MPHTELHGVGGVATHNHIVLGYLIQISFCLTFLNQQVRGGAVAWRPATTHFNNHILSATHCNSLQHTATNCNTLQHTATHLTFPNQQVQGGGGGAANRKYILTTLQHTATHRITLQHTATRYITLQHTATHGTTLQHTNMNQQVRGSVSRTAIHNHS